MELNELVLRACESDFRKRYSSAKELNADLGILHRGESVTHARRLEKHKALAMRVALVTALIGLLGAGGEQLILRLPERTAQVDERWKPVKSLFGKSRPKPESVVVVGDSPRGEVAPAVTLGCRAVLVRRPDVWAYHAAVIEGPYHTVDDVTELAALLGLPCR